METEARQEKKRDGARPSRIIVTKIISVIKKLPVIPGTVLIVFLVFGIFADVISPHDPIKTNLRNSLIVPAFQEGGVAEHRLGTDQLGRDMLSRLIHGATISLQVGLTVVLIAGSIGMALALISGYFGGWVDMILMRVTDVMLSMPLLIIAIALAAVLGPSLNNVILILVLLGWAQYARVIRSEVLRIKDSDFIRLARVAGVSNAKIIVRHVLPNVVNTFIILATLQVGAVISWEATLSFLGVGVPPPRPSWGGMLSEGRAYITYAWWLCVFPGVAIFLVMLSLNFLGDWLRVRLDPKFRQI